MTEDGPVLTRKQAKKLLTKCPECNRTVHGTGRIQERLATGAWYVQYHCPEHGDLWIYDSRMQDQVKAIATGDPNRGKRV